MSGEIKDSGSRRVFDTGATRDIQEGKGREDLLPMHEIADLYQFKYDNYTNLNIEITPLSESDLFFFIGEFMIDGDTKCIYNILLKFIQREYNGSIETALMELAKHFDAGQQKYKIFNWQKGIPTHCFIDSALRHALKYFRGDKDEPHERAFMWNLVCLLWTKENVPEVDDILYGVHTAEAIDKYIETWGL